MALLVWSPNSLAQSGSQELHMVLSGFNQFVVTAPNGNRTGKAIEGEFIRFNEIEGAEHYIEGGSLDPDVPGEVKIFLLPDPQPGEYTVTIYGERTTESNLWMRLGDQVLDLFSVATKASRTDYLVTYDPTDGAGALSARKVVSSASAQHELEVMSELGWIQDADLLGELSTRFAQVSDELAADDTTEARAMLEELDVRLDEVQTELSGEAYVVLKGDVEALLAELPEPLEELPLLADVRPILECVADNGDGTYTAFFGYENLDGEPGTIPYGASNRLAPTRYQGQQPDTFTMPNVVPGRPGRTLYYPGHAFTVTFSRGQVVWRLRNRISRAGNDPAQRCPDN